MKLKNQLVIFATFILLTACGARTVSMQWQAVGGSRADATLNLAAETRHGVRYTQNNAQANAVAAKRCRAWGYQNAEAFGGATRKCISSNAKTCLIWEHTRIYQCTGNHANASGSNQPVVVNVNNYQTPNPATSPIYSPVNQLQGEQDLKPVNSR